MVSDWRKEASDVTIEAGAAVQAALGFTPTADLATLRVFPVKGKRPLMKGWKDAAPIDLDIVAGWQDKYPGCNWGAALDADTLVIDCDSDAATSALYDLAEAYGGIPATLTTMTGRGFHFWFHTPVAVRNGVGVMPGIDVRTKGGLVVVPPSVHQNGTHYQFADISAPIVDAPEWLLLPEPMSRFEVERIIANAMKFDSKAVGGNTLVEAWSTVEQIEAGSGATKWYQFLLLVEQLAEMRPETRQTILLPVRLVGTLMGAHWTEVGKWRQRAVGMGVLSITAPYVRRCLATEFAVKAGFSPLADGPALYKVKRGRRPKTMPVEQDQAA